MKVDGTTFNEPISVGDPGAKGARPGDKVVIEIVQYPSPDRGGEGVIIEVLGAHGQPGVDTLSVIRAFNIPDTFDDAELEEAREQARLFEETAIGSREDLTAVRTVTIDPANARDFDDAISLRTTKRGTGAWLSTLRMLPTLCGLDRHWTALRGTVERACTFRTG